MRAKTRFAITVAAICLAVASLPVWAAAPPGQSRASARGAANLAAMPTAKAPEHLVFWQGTPEEVEVFKLYGREKGPTVMIVGGIQGDEPGGFLSADLYADVSLKKGNLIVVPRANFKSVLWSHRGPGGDMNRKFAGTHDDDPELKIIAVLRSLMAESDLFLNMHDGSGYYRPTWESDMANPNRYGQCIIADADVYTHEPTGRAIPLASYAEQVVERVNKEISLPLHKFHFFNMRTTRPDTRYKEQRGSATYYALTHIGIPAFGIETSKQLPSTAMKVYQHNLAVNAFLDLFGVEVDQPGLALGKPVLGYIILTVNDAAPLAAAPGQTLLVSPGDKVEVLHAGTNYERGVSVQIEGGGLNDLRRPVTVNKAATVTVRRDNTVLGKVRIDLLPEDDAEQRPRLVGDAKVRPPRLAMAADLDRLPGTHILAEIEQARTQTVTLAAAAAARQTQTAAASPADQTPAGQQSIPTAAAPEADQTTAGTAMPPAGDASASTTATSTTPVQTPSAGASTTQVASRNATAQVAQPDSPAHTVPTEQATSAGATAALPMQATQPATSAGPTATSPVQAADAPFSTEHEPGRLIKPGGEPVRGIAGFLFTVDGRPIEVKPGGEFAVTSGSRITIVDLKGEGGRLPKDVVMNLRGFLPKKNERNNTGEDRGTTADTGVDMLPGFSEQRKGERYAVNAEVGKDILASCTLIIEQPKLASVTVRLRGEEKTLALGSRSGVPAGAPLELIRVSLKNDVPLTAPRYTLGGHPLPATHPVGMTMRNIAVNLAVFNGSALAGKVTLIPMK